MQRVEMCIREGWGKEQGKNRVLGREKEYGRELGQSDEACTVGIVGKRCMGHNTSDNGCDVTRDKDYCVTLNLGQRREEERLHWPAFNPIPGGVQ